MGGVPLQMPADNTVLDDPALKEVFERWWSTPAIEANDRMKLYKLGWDLTGSEFAGRHQLYEKFYAGHSAIVRASCDREAPWEKFHATVDRALAIASSDSAAKKIPRRCWRKDHSPIALQVLDDPLQERAQGGNLALRQARQRDTRSHSSRSAPAQPEAPALSG